MSEHYNDPNDYPVQYRMSLADSDASPYVDDDRPRPRKVRRAVGAVGMVSPVAYDPSPSTLTTNVLLLVLLLMFLCMIVLIIVLCRLGELQKSSDFIIQQTMALHGAG
jgi:hypothetical protein